MSVLVKRNALSKGWKRYQIMHKNRHVASIREDGSCTVYYKSFLPYNLYLEKADEGDVAVRLNNLANFYYWCASRVLTLDRKYAKEILNSIGATQAVTDKERAMIAISYHGVCLTDVYWIKSDRENIRFEDVSLFRHSLSSAFADVSLRGANLTVQNTELLSYKDSAGDVATHGVAPKAWVRRRGKFFLLKDGDPRDVEAELLASKIADCFNVDHVKYTEDCFDGQTVTRSSLITSEELSIVPMEFISVYCDNREMDPTDYVLSKDAYNYHMMNIIDYLVGNTDRHWGNWGFYVDNEKNLPVKLYPLMDFNKSFTAYSNLDGARCQTTRSNLSQLEAARQSVEKIGLNQIKKVNPAWFPDEDMRSMFFKRLAALK